MIFTIEALDASQGDCLLLHHGTAKAPSWILIDGGPSHTYNRSLLPRLRQLHAALELDAVAPVPLGLVVLSHIDDDHVAGLLKLFSDLAQAHDEHRAPIAEITELWHNSFDAIVGSDQAAAAIEYLDQLPVARERGVVAGTRQGHALLELARRLEVAVNAQFRHLVARPDDAGVTVKHESVQLTVLGPSERELGNYQRRWDREVEAGALASAALDSSTFNLSSIALLAECGKHKVLLTGDGRGDHVLEGLIAAGYLDRDGEDELEVDVFKLPHHGSRRNVTPELLRRVKAKTYVISANGKHDNPDIDTLDLLADARGDDPYTLALTFPEAAYKEITASSGAEFERRAALERIDAWLRKRPEGNPTIIYRDPNESGVRIELGDEPCF